MRDSKNSVCPDRGGVIVTPRADVAATLSARIAGQHRRMSRPWNGARVGIGSRGRASPINGAARSRWSRWRRTERPMRGRSNVRHPDVRSPPVKRAIFFFVVSVMTLAPFAAAPARAADDYKLGPDSIQRHESVPKGRVEKFSLNSQIYPGTVRDVWVYIPAQYDGSRPACLMVFQDGQGCVSETGEWRV